jgi:hypothetical protein
MIRAEIKVGESWLPCALEPYEIPTKTLQSPNGPMTQKSSIFAHDTLLLTNKVIPPGEYEVRTDVEQFWFVGEQPDVRGILGHKRKG